MLKEPKKNSQEGVNTIAGRVAPVQSACLERSTIDSSKGSGPRVVAHFMLEVDQT
jgi:hypothetical protein